MENENQKKYQVGSMGIPRVLDTVVDILKAAGRPLVAREITTELNRRSIAIDKTALNQILWKKSRPELQVNEQTWEWKYDPAVAKHLREADARIEDSKQQLGTSVATNQILNGMGFDFFGVIRKGSPKPFFFVKEVGEHYVMVGPSGNVLSEKSDICSAPEIYAPSDFTNVQIKQALEEYEKEFRCQVIEDRRRMIKFLRETERLANDVYSGPSSVRIEDAIPVTGLIYVVHLTAVEPYIVAFGVGSVFEPVYLVVELLGGQTERDTRYGVFKLCLYELLKKDLIVESGGDLHITLSYNMESVVIRNENIILHLN